MSVTTGVCSFCSSKICNSLEPWGKHHQSYGELQASSKQHCVFCTRLLYYIDKVGFTNPNSLHWPLYRWNLRQVAQIRETPATVEVTFRPWISPLYEKEDSPGCQLQEITFHMYPEQDLGPLPSNEELGLRTDSRQSWDQVVEWVDSCVRDHERCRQRGRPFLPTRLVDIGKVNIEQNTFGAIYVVDTRHQHVEGRYATLSHCWGKKRFLNLYLENRDRLMNEGIQWDDKDLPPNFKDAIIAVRHLKIRYVWIDSLCIVQNKVGGDFQAEGKLMHMVYRHSYCNIAVADSQDSQGGLFRPADPTAVRDTATITLARFSPRPGNHVFGSHAWRIIPKDLWDVGLLKEVLYTRGWVFQERMLAPRILHFCADQIFWDCATISACEALPFGFPRPSEATAAIDRHWRQRLQVGSSLSHRPLAGTADVSFEEFWVAAVRSYTSCSLTQGSDKLLAVWGIAKLVSDALAEGYGAGMWSVALEEQLSWYVVDCKQADGTASVRPKDEPRRAPSWSWASVDGIIQLNRRSLRGHSYIVSNHSGDDIAFQLESTSNHNTARRKVQNELEELELRDEELRAVAERRRSNTPRSSTSSKLPRTAGKNMHDDSEPPRLESTKIEIWGHLRAGQLNRDVETGKWALSIQDEAPIASASGEAMEIFPDQEPESGSRDCYWLVLTFDGYPDPDEYDEDLEQTGSSAVGGERKVDDQPHMDAHTSESYSNGAFVEEPEELQKANMRRQFMRMNARRAGLVAEVPHFSGQGIILEKATEDDHYYRCGSFFFHDLTVTSVRSLTRIRDPLHRLETGNIDRGQKIWLT